MALQMAYTDATRTLHDESYWRLTHLNIDATLMTADMVFDGYHNVSAADRSNLAARVGQYTIKAYGPEFLALAFGPIQGTTPWGVISTAVYNYAKNQQFYAGSIDV